MTSFSEARQLPFPPERLFEIAADIERYPDFLDGWLSAHIIASTDDACIVDQVLGLGPMRLRFTSHAVFHPPERIEVTCVQSPFRRFALSWQFTTVEHGSHVNVAADVQMQSMLLQKVVDTVLPTAVDDIMDAFAARALQRSGVPRIAATSATPPKV